MQGDGADIVEHFTARADQYDRSSRWCTDAELLDAIYASASVDASSTVLDLACGTGLVSRRFHGRVAELVGLDVTPAMAAQARPALDRFVLADATRIPLADDLFDAVVCRQGLQFMDLDRVLPELRRVLRPGGRLVTADLHAYGPEDRDEYFEVLRLRNPARRNFFVAGDMAARLTAAGFSQVTSEAYISEEDVGAWADNGAIADARQQGIRAVYEQGSAAFLRLHGAQVAPERILDRMRFEISRGLA
ncbi:MAG: class I SAM-dependent methyltransferase [Myxococcota bacterium]|nr:class I SAM-dependent methyltransferase [Myxococcota bacterium]